MATTEAWGKFVNPLPQDVLPYTTSESGVAHRLYRNHAACPVESISHGPTAGKIRELPGGTIISDTLIPDITTFHGVSEHGVPASDL